MRKLILDLDNLIVESFEVAESERVRGTVQGNDAPTPNCTVVTAACDTCYVSCNYSACPLDCDTNTCPIRTSQWTACDNC